MDISPLLCRSLRLTLSAGLAYWRHAGWRSGFWKGAHASGTEARPASGKYVAKVETVFTRMLRIYAGLSLGNLAASSVYWFVVMVPFVESTHHLLISHISNIVDITSELGAYAFCPALVIFLYAEFRGKRTWQFHALGGMVVTLTVLGMLSALHNFPPSAEDAPILLATFFAFAFCGATNGLVYWLIAVPGAGKLVRILLWPTSVSARS